MPSDTRERIREAYSKSGRTYDEVREHNPRGAMLGEHDVLLFNELLPDVAPGQEVCEIGAGTGRFTLPMLHRGLTVTATDVNQTMLDQLSIKLKEEALADQCRLGIEDVFNLSFEDASFDLAVAIHVIPRFLCHEDQSEAIKEIARILRPGAYMVFNYRNRGSMYAKFYRGYCPSSKEMDAMLREAGLRTVDKRGKHFLSRELLNKMPLSLGRSTGALDKRLRRFHPDRAWDVFLLTQKQ